MAAHGNAFLALWNDILRSREPEYDRWHTKEHVPERVAVIGFRGARRYVNRARAHHRYFTLYEVEDLAVFQHREYADLIDHPTPWSASMRPDFSNFLRATCQIVAAKGEGIGAALAVLCYEHSRAKDAEMALSSALDLPGVIAYQIGEGIAGTSTIAWATPPPETVPIRAFDRVALVEALDRDAAAAALTYLCTPLGLDCSLADFGCDVYDLAFVFPGHDDGGRRRHRRLHWDAVGR